MTQDVRQENQKPSPQRPFMARVLVTGFEPFGDNSRNISMEVLSQLPSFMDFIDPWAGLRATEIEPVHAMVETKILPVDELGANTVSNLLTSGEVWDVIVHLGLCESCVVPKIETRAQNKISMRIPDNSGRQISEGSLSQDGDLHVAVPVHTWVNQGLDAGWELSVDAGTFVCNETLYRTLHTLKEQRITDTPCIFVHLPDFERCTLVQASSLVLEVIERMLFRPVLSVVGGLIIRDDTYLIARRAQHEKHPGKWEFPGGKVEQGESLQQAIVREFNEELSWNVRSGPSIGVWHHSLDKFDIALNILPVEFTGALPDEQDKSGWTAHDAVVWRTIDDDSSLDWLGSDEQIVHWMRETGYLTKPK